jgi:uncharacterized protein (UPF0297 family)
MKAGLSGNDEEYKVRHGDLGGNGVDNQNEGTRVYKSGEEAINRAEHILRLVSRALRENGYDPAAQIVGYLISGDPTYITSHQDARKLIRQLERDRILDELVREYLKGLEVE